MSATATAVLTVEGMHCSSCVALVEESLLEVPGVAAASVDLEGGRAQVGFDPEQVDAARLAAVVAEAGYPSTPVA
jgi:copper chaperone CopZ